MINKVQAINDIRRDMPKHMMMMPALKKRETSEKEKVESLSFADVLKRTMNDYRCS